MLTLSILGYFIFVLFINALERNRVHLGFPADSIKKGEKNYKSLLSVLIKCIMKRVKKLNDK